LCARRFLDLGGECNDGRPVDRPSRDCEVDARAHLLDVERLAPA